ncbi:MULTISPECIES: hydrogenase [unclassified Nocardioides]|uniref:NADH-quinone oxidoreductase subunit B family protein n=1 Tax=unclassified Nocardioides TaxID=2615069 RepID=UPI0006F35D0D|nr:MULTISPECIES: hydrogenase [unclassified Nocardioides]KRA27975.1 hydrogenase [Nocardioides sp. Root614]KRA85949.1 hydrogenase [Nocardioides sp. Root682]
MSSVLWLQGGACSGNTMSFLNAEEPNVVDLIVDFGLELLWHPSLGLELGAQAQKIFWDCANGDRPLDIFVFEGTVIEKEGYDVFAEREMKDWVTDLANAASIVVAIGDCACWGGIPAMEPNPSQSTGLQFHKRDKGGFLGPDWTSKAGLPVINIPGCPSHPDWITQIIVALATGRTADIALDDLHRPQTFFKTFTQTGCTRVQFFDYKQSTVSFGEGTRTGCLFYEFGCRGPMTHSPCNRILWNRQSSKTRAGMPCLGCTEPEFPFFDLNKGTVFKTQKISGVIPKEVPEGADHLTYMAQASAARIAAPQWSKEDMFVV